MQDASNEGLETREGFKKGSDPYNLGNYIYVRELPNGEIRYRVTFEGKEKIFKNKDEAIKHRDNLVSEKNVLVKRLQAVDALGQTNIVALDKTGTITKNQMKVEKVFADNSFYYVSGDGYEPKGKIFYNESEFDFKKSDSLILLTKICASTSIGGYSFNEQEKVWESNYGDPTEVSLLVFAEKMGI
jgi:hypothetical protein